MKSRQVLAKLGSKRPDKRSVTPVVVSNRQRSPSMPFEGNLPSQQHHASLLLLLHSYTTTATMVMILTTITIVAAVVLFIIAIIILIYFIYYYNMYNAIIKQIEDVMNA